MAQTPRVSASTLTGVINPMRNPGPSPRRGEWAGPHPAQGEGTWPGKGVGKIDPSSLSPGAEGPHKEHWPWSQADIGLGSSSAS